MKKSRTKSGNVVTDIRTVFSEFPLLLYVVANRAQASFYRHSKGREFELLKSLSNPKAKLTESELISDKPGRGFSSASGTIRHGLGQSQGQHEHVAQTFAAKIAENLNSLHREQPMAGLALVAEPHFLGLLKQELSPQLKPLVKHKINKELTHLSEQELYEQIQTAINEQ